MFRVCALLAASYWPVLFSSFLFPRLFVCVYFPYYLAYNTSHLLFCTTTLQSILCMCAPSYLRTFLQPRFEVGLPCPTSFLFPFLFGDSHLCTFPNPLTNANGHSSILRPVPSSFASVKLSPRFSHSGFLCRFVLCHLVLMLVAVLSTPPASLMLNGTPGTCWSFFFISLPSLPELLQGMKLPFDEAVIKERNSGNEKRLSRETLGNNGSHILAFALSLSLLLLATLCVVAGAALFLLEALSGSVRWSRKNIDDRSTLLSGRTQRDGRATLASLRFFGSSRG